MPAKNKTSLIIVESPTKARTISSFLGKGYTVLSSYGHVRDLPTNKFDPKTRFGIDINNNFEPQYVIPAKAKENLSRLQKAAKKAGAIILASDEDREGESIAWHLIQALNLETWNMKHEIEDKKHVSSSKFYAPRVERIVFHEITKPAIEQALTHPRSINMDLVNAQQARRVLDRLAGYELSQFLWHKIKYGLSAGRVQSAALRLLCEREQQINAFKQTQYYTISAKLQKLQKTKPKLQIPNEFTAELSRINNEPITEPGILEKQKADDIVTDLTRADFSVAGVAKKNVARSPLAPFTTSTLQQDAWNKLHCSSKQTMLLAQQLYEQGLITYMRTDSTSLSYGSVVKARKLISEQFGTAYVPETFITYKTRSRMAQEAHEAIRPTDPFQTPETFRAQGDAKQHKLYALIWSRFIACQMAKAILAQTSVTICAQSQKNAYELKTNGQYVVFDGFLRVWKINQKETILPDLAKNDQLKATAVTAEEHFTQPPARYNDASLVKTLEQLGIGRPSTYASIMNTIINRMYVERTAARSLQPTPLGILVNDLVVTHFYDIVDYQFTAQIEQDFDTIAQGKKIWHEVIKAFYEPFHKNIELKEKQVSRREATERPSEQVCDKCGHPMVVKWGKYGQFLACSNYPACSNIKKIAQPKTELDMPCPVCGSIQGGKVVVRKTKARKRIFYGCSRWPTCNFASWKKPEEQNEEKMTK